MPLVNTTRKKKRVNELPKIFAAPACPPLRLARVFGVCTNRARTEKKTGDEFEDEVKKKPQLRKQNISNEEEKKP